MTNLDSRSPKNRDAARNRANGLFQGAENRNTLLKQEQDAERVATEAKTVRLRALRLAKEAEDRETARIAAENAPPKPPKKQPKS